MCCYGNNGVILIFTSQKHFSFKCSYMEYNIYTNKFDLHSLNYGMNIIIDQIIAPTMLKFCRCMTVVLDLYGSFHMLKIDVFIECVNYC